MIGLFTAIIYSPLIDVRELAPLSTLLCLQGSAHDILAEVGTLTKRAYFSASRVRGKKGREDISVKNNKLTSDSLCNMS